MVPENIVADNNVIPFTIDYRDIFTVPGEQEVNGVTGNIIYDGEDPELSLFTVTSNNDNDPKRAKVGDEITVTIKGEERLAKTADPYVERPAVTIAGTSVDATASDDTDSTWTATYTMQSTDTEGDISILLDYKDYAGNEDRP